MAGTLTRVSMRSCTRVRRNAGTVKVGSTTVVPPSASWTSSWLLHPVTWNNGTDTRFRVEGPLGAVDTNYPDRCLDVGQEVLVAGHGPLGGPGGATGVKDRGKIPRLLVLGDERFPVR